MFDQPRNPTCNQSMVLTAGFLRLAAIIFTAALLLYAFWDTLVWMVGQWDREEYSYAYLIPVVALLMAWQNWDRIPTDRKAAPWLGTGIVVVGLLVFLMGELGTLYTVGQYGFLITLAGLVVAYLGVRSIPHLWVPLVYLGFMIPLPSFLYNGLSSQLQLISSELGTALIRLLGISVFLSGNIIDLGIYKLQVVEACSGLRYLFPLMSFGFLAAYLYTGPIWQKAMLFVSTVPITVVMNSVRIAIIGVLVEYWGIGMAEGFLHDFEGWAVFLVCVAVLFAEVWVLMRLTGRSGPLSDYFRFDLPPIRMSNLLAGTARSLPKAYIAAMVLVFTAAVGTSFLEARAEIAPDRKAFVSFPDRIGVWEGQRTGMESKFLRILQLDDYILSNYAGPAHQRPINLYVAYYESQRKGQSAHSPSSCLPGDGWKIDSFEEHAVRLEETGKSLAVNRAIISKGTTTQLVYYWFQQRDRNLTSAYAVKWYLFWDALTRNRTDGALIRLVTPVDRGDFERADARLAEFARTVYPTLRDYVPG